ncbi:hypothetical protein GCM10010168_27770 [Actinoplanes ianthinogenes]|uniref:Alpha/beta hydrolase n=1 Tax=Actinoplanes ianthinogenes TaxID=122358 RepID=A0ABN6C5R0_9ACTN|nr:alpha/beta hydrolase [Actinoplanes ianthinogenes]BCJ39918.1 hypothetical protein Aiant_05750 [Actinoplanes ianthinogenes]GGR09007.1 hypothetical protein GCM10010168_27770 [Actinoplanes ianthinogenes]
MDPVAILIPGLAYSAERPLLHFAGAVFASRGWQIRPVSWSEPPPRRAGRYFAEWFTEQRSFVRTQLTPILDSVTASRVALAGKSMGAFAAALAAERELPAVWLTPVLNDSPLVDDLRAATAPFLLVGSDADPAWDAAAARGFGQPVCEVLGADHSLEFAGDPVRSVAALRTVTVAIDAFVRDLPGIGQGVARG